MRIVVIYPDEQAPPTINVPDLAVLDLSEVTTDGLKDGVVSIPASKADQVPSSWPDLILMLDEAIVNPLPNVNSQHIPADRVNELLDATIVAEVDDEADA